MIPADPLRRLTSSATSAGSTASPTRLAGPTIAVSSSGRVIGSTFTTPGMKTSANPPYESGRS